MSRSLRRASVALLAPAAVFALSVPASADPTHALTFPSLCSDGNTYDVAVPGNGYYLPALVATSTQVFKPVAFGVFTFTVTDPDGVVVAVDTQPATAQGGGNVLDRNHKTYLDCTALFTIALPDGFSVTIDGSVTGFLVPGATS